MKKRIAIVGSSNMDMVIKTDHFPAPGETVLSGSFFMNPGGKGANQAVAAARLGAEVVFVSRLGKDLFGDQLRDLLKKEGINTSYISTDEETPTGIAMITVDNNGENSIVVASGANGNLLPRHLQLARSVINNADCLLLQLEIPLDTVADIITFAAANRTRIILNPAPATSLRPELYPYIDILTPNMKEVAALSGMAVRHVEDAKKAALILCGQGIKTVIVTAGAAGAFICNDQTCTHIPAPRVTTVDSTAAGDVFNGGLAVALTEGATLHEAVQFACAAAAISVTRLGAQSSIPYRSEIGNPGRPSAIDNTIQ